MNLIPTKTLFFFTISTLLFMASPGASSPLHHKSAVKGVYWFQGSISVSSIDSSLFTHIFCAFANIDSETFHVTISSSDLPFFSNFTSTLQLKNPKIKTLLSIGGGGSNATAFATMASSRVNRKAFIDSSIAVARSLNFHGLDLDYEFPTTSGEMSNLGTLLSEWRSAVNAESKSTKKPRLLLTEAVYYSAIYHSLPLPAKAMAASLDWINVMAYDFWAPAWSTLTRPTAALYDPTSSVNAANGVKAWIIAGVPRSKVVLGFPFYGRAWKLANASDHGYLAATEGATAGTDNGAMTYRQIKEFLKKNAGSVTTVFNATTVESYSYLGDTWISYDDVDAIAVKMRFVRKNGLLGYFAWQVGGDDEKFTLAKTAARFSR